MNMIRIQLDLPEERVRQLDDLMEAAHITTRKDLFNSALTLLAWAVDEREKGRVIASLDENTGKYKELVMPFFSFLKKSGGIEGDNNSNGHRDAVDSASPRQQRLNMRGRRVHAGSVRDKSSSLIETTGSVKNRR